MGQTIEIPASEIPDGFISQMYRLLSVYFTTILLVNLQNDSPDKVIKQLGSGTFASIDNKYFGIITAGHVASDIPIKDQTNKQILIPENIRYRLGLVIRKEEEFQRFSIPIDQIDILKVGGDRESCHWPDIAFIKIPDYFIGEIRAVKSFYNLTAYRIDDFNNPEKVGDPYFIMGSPKVGTIDLSDIDNEIIEKKFLGFCGLTVIEREFIESDYDYYELPVDYVEEEYIPEDFTGISGSGVWKIPIKNGKGDTIAAKNIHLAGLVICQTDVQENHRILLAHGAMSLHVRLVELIRKKYGTIEL